MAVSGTTPAHRISSEKDSVGHSSANDVKTDHTILGEKGNTFLGEKDTQNHGVYDSEAAPVFDPALENHFGEAIVVTNAEELVTTVLHVDDDPTLSPWTFRACFLG